MPKNYFPAACTPAIKLPDLQPPDLEFLRSVDSRTANSAEGVEVRLNIDGIVLVCEDDPKSCPNTVDRLLVAYKQPGWNDIYRQAHHCTRERPKSATIGGVPVLITKVEYAYRRSGSEPEDRLEIFIVRDRRAAAKSPMSPIQKHAAASEQFFKDNPGWENVKWKTLRYAAGSADIDEMARASGNGPAEESFIEWVTAPHARGYLGADHAYNAVAPRPSAYGAARNGKLTLLTIGRTTFDAWAAADDNVLYIREPANPARVLALQQLDDAIARQTSGRFVNLGGTSVFATRIERRRVDTYYEIHYEKLTVWPPDARVAKLTILGETFDALLGDRPNEFVVPIGTMEMSARAARVIHAFRAMSTVAELDGRRFVVADASCHKIDCATFCLVPERINVKPAAMAANNFNPVEFVREWQCEFAEKTDAEIRREREAPLVALVNNVPEGLDPVGWRAAVLAVDEAHIMSSKARVRWDYERLSEWLPTVLEKGMDECDAGAPYADGLAAYRRAVAPHKAPTRQPRSWRDVGPRLTVDIDDGRDE